MYLCLLPLLLVTCPRLFMNIVVHCYRKLSIHLSSEAAGLRHILRVYAETCKTSCIALFHRKGVLLRLDIGESLKK